MTEVTVAPFYVGQKVLGSDYAPVGSRIKKGHPYIIVACHLSINPANGLGPFWYVGVEEAHDWLTPKLFVPVQENSIMTFSEIKEVENIELLINN